MRERRGCTGRGKTLKERKDLIKGRGRTLRERQDLNGEEGLKREEFTVYS